MHIHAGHEVNLCCWVDDMVPCILQHTHIQHKHTHIQTHTNTHAHRYIYTPDTKLIFAAELISWSSACCVLQRLTRTHTHTRTHACVHTQMHTCSHKCAAQQRHGKQSKRRTNIYKDRCNRRHSYSHTHTHTHIIHTCMEKFHVMNSTMGRSPAIAVVFMYVRVRACISVLVRWVRYV